MCPDCLVELVDDLDARVRCRHCGPAWPATMDSCPVCLAELRPDPAAGAEALGDILGRGGHPFRPDHLPAFRDGPSCTLLRLSGRGSLVLLGGDGAVAGPGRPFAPAAGCRGLVPATKVLLGRPWPVPARPADEEREGWRPFD